VLHYTIKPNEPSPPSPQAWDVEIKVEDVSLKAKMNQVVLSMSSESAKELAKLDEQVRLSLFPITRLALSRMLYLFPPYPPIGRIPPEMKYL
jgi:hypothetical protein